MSEVGDVEATGAAGSPSSLLEVADLTIDFPTRNGVLRAVDSVQLRVGYGEILGLVGESGSGKSLTGKSILGIVPKPGLVVGGSIMLAGKELVGTSAEHMRRLRSTRIGLVPQNPMTALNPVLRVGYQMAEVLPEDRSQKRRARKEELASALARVGLPDPKGALDRYPHEFSGGGRQRILIAMAVLNKVDLLIADEPTTALDATIQAQILALIRGLTDDLGMSTLFITHNMGVVASICDRLAVMYAGEIVENGSVEDLLRRPQHPYTAALLRAAPSQETIGRRLTPIPGSPPELVMKPTECRFMPRCQSAAERCVQHPDLIALPAERGRTLRCWRPWLDPDARPMSGTVSRPAGMAR